MRRVSLNTSAGAVLAIAAVAALAASAVGESEPPPVRRTAPETQPAVAAELLEKLRRAVEAAPESASARGELGGALMRKGDYSGAADALRPVASELGANETLWLSRALACTHRSAQAADVLRQALQRSRACAELWTELVQLALDSKRYGLALQRVQQARASVKAPPARLGFQAATAYFHLGQALGATSVREIPGGRPGRFAGELLLVERRGDQDRFLCCPRESAMYELRKALDGGLDDQAADCLHAAVWAAAGRPKIGLEILRGREAAWREGAAPESLRTLADLALTCGETGAYLKYARRLAMCDAGTAEDVMYEAYVSAARLYNERGDQAMYRELLERAMEIQQDDVELMLSLGDAIWESGDRDQARAWYRRMLGREPDHPQRYRVMDRLDD